MAWHPFLVDVTALRRAPGSVVRVQREGTLSDLAVTGSAVPSDAVATIDAQLCAAADTVVVTADVTAPWSGPCRRCLGDATGTIEAHVREVYEHGSDGEDTYAFTGDRIDLEPLVRDAVFLGLPPAPLCREGCRGLCPQCGANRNDGECDCDQQPTDPRWAALNALQGD